MQAARVPRRRTTACSARSSRRSVARSIAGTTRSSSAQMLAERDDRYRRHSGSVYLQEPNVKESAGGFLTSPHALWLASARFGARIAPRTRGQGTLTAKERTATDAALTFLWRVRNELHFPEGRSRTSSSAELQAPVAKSLGYRGRRGPTRWSRRFMRDHYRHARTIHRISARADRALPGGDSRATARSAGVRPVVPRSPTGWSPTTAGSTWRSPAPSRRTPPASCGVFWHAQQLGCELRRRARAGARRRPPRRSPIRPGGRRLTSAPCSSSILAPLLGPRGDHAPADARHGVLGAYLPEFGALDCLVQYDHYHRYSVDQHSLLAVEVLEGLGPGRARRRTSCRRSLPRWSGLELLMLRHPPPRHRQRRSGTGTGRRACRCIKAVTRRLQPGRRRRGGGRVPGRASPPALAHGRAPGHRRSEDRRAPGRRGAVSRVGSPMLYLLSPARTSARSARASECVAGAPHPARSIVRTRTAPPGRASCATPGGRGPAASCRRSRDPGLPGGRGPPSPGDVGPLRPHDVARQRMAAHLRLIDRRRRRRP